MGKKIKQKMKNSVIQKYRFTIRNVENFEVLWSQKISKLNIYSVIIGASLVLIILTFVTLVFTPVREIIPGFPNKEMRREILYNKVEVDSLVNEIVKRDSYISKIKEIIQGNVDDVNSRPELSSENIVKSDSLHSNKEDIIKSNNTQVINSKTIDNTLITSSSIRKNYFYCPIKGVITNGFNPENSHFGIDIASDEKDIFSIANGVVVLSTWTLETGYTIQIQHANNLISVYKHNSVLLKEEGEDVVAGEIIAVYGNSGEITTGPHLHFEMWLNGKAVNPIDYIIF